LGLSAAAGMPLMELARCRIVRRRASVDVQDVEPN
jgi:hypothetical protein